MKTLVVGSDGYIGSHIVKTLFDAGHDAVTLDNLVAGHRDHAMYDRGEFVHSNIQDVGGGGSINNTFYGETFIPESYACRAYESILKFEKFVAQLNYHTQPIIFFRKR